MPLRREGLNIRSRQNLLGERKKFRDTEKARTERYKKAMGGRSGRA